MKRFFTVLMAMATFLATMTLPALADIEDAIEDGEAGVRLLTTTTAAVTRGDDVWVMLNWTAFGDGFDGVEDFEVTLRKRAPNGVTVDYPENTVDHTSLWDNNSLSVGEIDYTALNVAVDGDYNKNEIKLRLNLRFTVDGEPFRQRHTVTIPVVSFEGDPVEQVTHDWGTANAGDAAWYEIAFAGQAPEVTDFSVVITQPAGMNVVYPQGSHTSLHFDDVLESRETDVVRIFVQTAAMEPGDYVLTVECDYTHNGRQVTETDTVTFTITAP